MDRLKRIFKYLSIFYLTTFMCFVSIFCFIIYVWTMPKLPFLNDAMYNLLNSPSTLEMVTNGIIYITSNFILLLIIRLSLILISKYKKIEAEDSNIMNAIFTTALLSIKNIILLPLSLFLFMNSLETPLTTACIIISILILSIESIIFYISILINFLRKKQNKSNKESE